MKHNVTAGERWDTASIARSARVFLPCVLQRSLTGLGATAIRRVNGAYSTHKKCTGPSTEAWGTPEVTPEVRNFTPLLSTNCVLLERRLERIPVASNFYPVTSWAFLVIWTW
ncbi:uncharacterized protein LOC119166698 isoform X2 [Rhipicephalus microplus]|uniref:uncharacterized protein LOC119166698 isoform X2 n=1 Tax=Rhipicephalus microplus TaxID=6941 RepID=UPI003F6C1C64